MRLESQLSRMNCQTFSTGLSSGHFGGSRMMVILAGTRRRVDKCQPAWSNRRMAWAAGATVAAISARCKFIARCGVAEKARIGRDLFRSEDDPPVAKASNTIAQFGLDREVLRGGGSARPTTSFRAR